MDPQRPEPPGTRREAARPDDVFPAVPGTRREAPPAEPEPRTSGLLGLPADLAAYRVVAELAGGAEADVLHVRDAVGHDHVIKVYRRGLAVDEAAAARLHQLDRTWIVAPVEIGLSEGRRWERMEYLPNGTLDGFVAGRPGGLPVDQVTQVVAQLVEALSTLHRAGIVHGDLKPSNVLLRQRTPLALAVTDFGVSKYLGQATSRFTSRAMTVAYASPESFSGRFSPSVDWWALGMIVRQLATGAVPFAGLDDRVIMHELLVRGVSLDGVTQPRLNLLCKGLLLRDPDHRWGEREARAWLAGDSPPVFQAAAATVAKPLVVNGTECWTRADAARTLAAHWSDATGTYLGRPGSAGWQVLCAWLEQFDADVEARVRLVDQVLGNLAWSADRRMLHLLRWLDPAQPPYFLGLRVAPADLVTIAGKAAREPNGPAAALIEALWRDRLLTVLGDFAGGERLPAIDRQWQRLDQAMRTQATRTDVPPSVRAVLAQQETTHRIILLGLAAEPAYAQPLLAQAAQRRQALAGRSSWLDRQPPAHDEVSALVVVAGADAAAAEEAQARAARERASQLWAAEEAARQQKLPAALGYAAAAAALWAPVVYLVGYFYLASFVPAADPASAATADQGTNTHDLMFLLFVLAWLVPSGAELACAMYAGGDYHPRRSALGQLPWLGRRAPDVWDAMRRAGNRVRGLGARSPFLLGFLLCVGLDALSFLWGLFILALSLTVAAAAIGDVVWAGIRVMTLRTERERRRIQLTGQPPPVSGP